MRLPGGPVSIANTEHGKERGEYLKVGLKALYRNRVFRGKQVDDSADAA
jgi:hypothetical protein